MCGVAGVFGPGVETDSLVKSGVLRMAGAQGHRGPDDEGSLCRKSLVMGHRRLSIIDLSAAGRQPMCNEDGTVWVAYNGEIYNHRELRAELEQRGHRFVSSSDTEVIVHSYEQYGVPELFHRLRGMFALALYDGRTHEPTLVLARDRFGIKPLYYACADGRVLFASEVRALRRSGLIPLEEDSRAWLAFLCFGSVPTPWTTLRTVRALEPGHWLVASCGDVRLKRYYSLGSLFQPKDLNSDGKGSVLREEFPARLRHKLQEAVGIHLISDAPLGVFLSGGIDSSCLVALATEEKPDLITLGVTFQEQSFSEERYQRIVVERFNTRHHSVSVRFADFQEELPGFWDSLDQPTVDGVNTYFVARAAQQVGLKTVLSGIGGDEVFSGYPTLRRATWLWRLQKLPAPVRQAVVAVAGMAPSLRKLAFLRRQGRLPFYLVQRGVFTPQEAAQLVGASEG